MPFGIADQDVGPAAGALQRALGDGDVVAREIQLGVARLREQDLLRVRDRDLAAADREDFVFGLSRHRLNIGRPLGLRGAHLACVPEQTILEWSIVVAGRDSR